MSYDFWRHMIFDATTPFSRKVLEIFRHQRNHVSLYARFIDQLAANNSSGKEADTFLKSDHKLTSDHYLTSGQLEANQASVGPGDYEFDVDRQIPLMPIQVFRDFQIRADYVTRPETVFQSSGTTGLRKSTHEIADVSLYIESCLRGFKNCYNPDQFAILAWLPGYADNPNSSLVAMVDALIRNDPSGLSRFLPLDQPLQESAFEEITARGKRIMLFGAAFGLLDLIDRGVPALPEGAIIVETGGMKTHRREISKRELHQRLADGFSITPDAVHSEYGMAELCSQAWDTGGGWFECPPWMKVTIRDPDNPTETMPAGKEGLIGVIDLANVHSLSFILTQDRGVAREDGAFQVLGRWEFAELRGCNFLMD